MEQMQTLAPFTDIGEAIHEVLKSLQDHFDFDLVMMTRTEGDRWIVLDVLDRSYGVRQGDVYSWLDSYCVHMVRGDGPCIAPDSQQIPLYREAAIGERLPIRSYIGLPVRLTSGELFGTLCAIHPEPKSAKLLKEWPLLVTLVRLLSQLIDTELGRLEEIRQKERVRVEARRDALTGLYNRQGWNELLEAEERRCRKLGLEAGVLFLDVDNLKQLNDAQGHRAGDSNLIRVAQTLAPLETIGGVSARWGGDEFVVLVPNCSPSQLAEHESQLLQALSAQGLTVSLGSAVRSRHLGLQQAVEEADRRMYERKLLKQGCS